MIPVGKAVDEVQEVIVPVVVGTMTPILVNAVKTNGEPAYVTVGRKRNICLERKNSSCASCKVGCCDCKACCCKIYSGIP